MNAEGSYGLRYVCKVANWSTSYSIYPICKQSTSSKGLTWLMDKLVDQLCGKQSEC